MSSKQREYKAKQVKAEEDEVYGFPVYFNSTLVEENPETKRNTNQIGKKSRKERCISEFDPSVLPNELLDDLWQVAKRKNMIDLQTTIEEERFRRLKKEMEIEREMLFG